MYKINESKLNPNSFCAASYFKDKLEREIIDLL